MIMLVKIKIKLGVNMTVRMTISIFFDGGKVCSSAVDVGCRSVFNFVELASPPHLHPVSSQWGSPLHYSSTTTNDGQNELKKSIVPFHQPEA